MTIDMHSHWKPAALTEALRRRSEPPMIVRGEDGGEVFRDRRGETPVADAFDDANLRLRSMDEFGIDRAMLSMLGGFGWIERLPVDQSVPLVRLYNDGISALCRDHGARFTAVAAVPLRDLSAAADEFERAIALPGIVGVNLPGDGFVTYERARAFRPLLDIAQRHHAIVFIHRAGLPDVPSPRVGANVDNHTARSSTLDMQASLSSIMITLSLTDILDDYPDATVVTHNLGGNIPFEVERLDHRSETSAPEDEPPSVRIRNSRVVVDCNSFGARSIERAVEVYGAERIVFGTDGSDFGSQWSLKALAEARIGNAERQAILHDNAAAILDRSAGISAAAE